MTRPVTASKPHAVAVTQRGRVSTGLALSALSMALTFTVAVLGPSLVEPALPGTPGQPPWSFSAHPSPYLVVALSIAAIAAGTGGLGLSMRAARLGWMPSPRVLLAVGMLTAVALALVPPFGSSDHLSYAAYGRIAALGHDPYTMTPAALGRLGDPVGRAARQFQASPSVYGALATAGQELASRVGGTSVRLTVFVLSVLNVAAFAVTGLLLHWLARGDRAGQVRAALLWTANPLLLLVLVAGEHIDSQALVFLIAALAAFSFCSLAGPGWTRAVLPAAGAGALIGLGFAVKISMVLAGAGLATACWLAWKLRNRRDPQRASQERARLLAAAGGLAAGFAAVAVGALAAWGAGSLSPSLKAASMTSFASPWRAVRALLGLALGSAAAKDATKAAATALAVVLLILLLRQVAGYPIRGERPLLAAGSSREAYGLTANDPVPLQDLAVMCAAAFAIAWLFAWRPGLAADSRARGPRARCAAGMPGSADPGGAACAGEPGDAIMT